MTSRIDIHVFTPGRWFSTDDLRSAVSAGSAELLAFLPHRTGADGFVAAAAERLDRQPEAAGALGLFGPEPLLQRVSALPARVLGLAGSPERLGGAVVRRSDLAAMTVQPGAAPALQAAVLQILEQGRRIEVLQGRSEVVPTAELPALAPAPPGRETDWLRHRLLRFDWTGLGEVTSRDDAVAFQAGLLQLHDDLDESHRLSQSVEGRGRRLAGDYWHAIHHRREPDDSNSKYWFRRVGRHSVFDDLAPIAEWGLTGCSSSDADAWRQRLLPHGSWDPLAMVDFCAACRRDGDRGLTEAARRIQYAEMLLLLASTYGDATS